MALQATMGYHAQTENFNNITESFLSMSLGNGGNMRLYHRTTSANAASILTRGFKDAVGRYMTEEAHEGVWLSDRPLDANEGANGDTLLVVDLDVAAEELADKFEWEEEGKPYREFLVPAALVNANGKIAVVED